MDRKRKLWLIIVNLITLSRIVGSIILFPILFRYGKIVLGIVLTLLFATDWIDGFIARKYHVSTFFGSIMDSVCDKTVAITACIVLYFINKYVILTIIIELLICLVNIFVLTQNGNVKSSKIGKLKMWFLSGSIILGFFLSSSTNNCLNFLIFLPTIIMQTLALIDYSKNIFKVNVKITAKKPKYKKASEIKWMLFNPEFYSEYKDSQGLITHIYKDGNN